MMAKNVREGWHVQNLGDKYDDEWVFFKNPDYKKPVSGEVDQWVDWPGSSGGKVRVEVTGKTLTGTDVRKVEDRMAYVAKVAKDGDASRRMVYMVDKPPSAEFFTGSAKHKGVNQLREEYGVDFWLYVRSTDTWTPSNPT